MGTLPALNILIVEDYDLLREAMVKLLSRHGHHVVGVPMAEDVDDAPLGCLPDVYLIDINLPGEDGFSLAQRIRRNAPHAGIVMTTARTDVNDRVAGYSSGADVYISKPVAPEELVAVVHGLAQRLRRLESQHVSSLALHPRRLLLKGPAMQTGLTQSEVVLLGAFARAADHKLEHWQVAQHLSTGQELTKENLEVRLGRLRKKLQSCGASAPAIKSIRGEGYKLLCSVEVLAD